MARMKARFRGFLPVVVDLETGGFDKDVHALLQVGAASLHWMDDELCIEELATWNVVPHPEMRVEAASLELTGIDLDDPERHAQPEEAVVRELFRFARRAVRRHGCQRALLTGHNAHFDHGFMLSAANRNGVKRSPFHPFTVVDTASLAAVAYGHTVLREACQRAGLGFEGKRAHAAAYDVEATARLFCSIVNAWDGFKLRGERGVGQAGGG